MAGILAIRFKMARIASYARSPGSAQPCSAGGAEGWIAMGRAKKGRQGRRLAANVCRNPVNRIALHRVGGQDRSLFPRAPVMRRSGIGIEGQP